MPLCFAGLMCHAPIVVPAVGGRETEKCRATTRAMGEVATRAVASNPDRLVLISPHSPRHPTRFSAWTGRHQGDLGDFRAPDIRIDLPDAPEVAQALDLVPIGPDSRPRPREGWLDHGAMVPLSFLWQAGWRGPTAILALPWEDDPDCDSIGRALAALPGRTAIIASGDMSHRLKPGAPAGYHPDAATFDKAFVAALEEEEWEAISHLPHREVAAEDVVASVRVALSAAGSPLNSEVLSYEGPWGVGYTEAILYDPEPPLYTIARRTVKAGTSRKSWAPPEGGSKALPVFVTIRKDGQLRGCIGCLEARTGRLFDEVHDQARAAAFRDPRFPPVSASELSLLHFEVSVLEPAEDIDGIHQLDPAIYGVIVRSGLRRGVMLPNVEGIDDAATQVALTCRKVGIDPRGPLKLQRFRVRKEIQP